MQLKGNGIQQIAFLFYFTNTYSASETICIESQIVAVSDK
jgi:hypothetical protein